MHVWRVSLPDRDPIQVKATSRLYAIWAAAKVWKLRWTDMARACTVDDLGIEQEQEKKPAARKTGRKKGTP